MAVRLGICAVREDPQPGNMTKTSKLEDGLRAMVKSIEGKGC